MTLIVYKGKRGTTFGYRFWHRNTLFQRMIGPKHLAIETEKRERARLLLGAWENTYGPLRPQPLKIADAVSRFLAAKEGKPVARDYRAHLDWWEGYFARAGITFLQDIAPEHLEAARRELATTGGRGGQGRDPVTVENHFRTVRALLRMAVRKWKALRESPVALIDWPRAPRKTRVAPTLADYYRLLQVCDRLDPALKPIIVTAVHTGLRESAVMALTAEAFRVRPGWLKGRDEKRGEDVWLPVTPTLKETVAGLRVAKGPLFRSPRTGTAMRFPHNRWRALRAAAKLPAGMTFHDLRHLCGTVLVESGVELRIVQRWLGHRSVAMTERYTEPHREALEQAAKRLEKAAGLRKAEHDSYVG